MASSAVVFRPISTIGGVEALGVDLREEQSEAVKHQLKKACLTHSLLLLRNQVLTLQQQLQFAQSFGVVLDNNVPGQELRESFVTSVGEIWMHFDHWLRSGYPEPLHYTLLYGMKVVPTGGETIFTNAKLAYQNLPAPLRERIQQLEALHCYNYSYSPGSSPLLRVREADLSPDQPRAIHPVIRVHPQTGEKVLYISPRNTDCIVGVDPQESEALLQELVAYFQQPKNVYAHKWEVGDLLIWDNHTMLHGRREYDPQHERQLRRMCII